MTDDKNRSRLDIRVDPDLADAAKEAAYQARLSLTAWVAEALAEKLARGSAPG